MKSLKETFLSLIGLKPAGPPPFAESAEVQYLRRQGYRVRQCEADGWHWYHGHALSGRYTSEKGAWCAAAFDYEQRQGEAE